MKENIKKVFRIILVEKVVFGLLLKRHFLWLYNLLSSGGLTVVARLILLAMHHIPQGLLVFFFYIFFLFLIFLMSERVAFYHSCLF